MSKSNLIIIAVFAAVIAVLLWWFSDTQVIKRRTHALAETVTVARSDGKGSRAMKTKDLSSLLSPDTIASIDVSRRTDSFSKDEMLSAHHMLVHNCRSSSAIFSDLEITFENDNKATVTATLDVVVTDNGGGEYKENCQAALIWEKNDQDQWRLTRANVHGE